MQMTTLILKDLESVKEVIRKVERYCKGTGARVNEEKMMRMRLCNEKNK